MRLHAKIVSTLCLMGALAAPFSMTGVASASTSPVSTSATVNGGTATMIAPATAAGSPVTIGANGADISIPIALEVQDFSGLHTGDHITAHEDADLNDGNSHSLPTSLASGSAPACQTNATCTVGSNVTLGSGTLSTTDMNVLAYGTNSGVGDTVYTPSITATVPVNGFAGTYTNTITLTFVAGS